MAAILFRRNGGAPAPLPFDAFDAAGDHWSDLANNPEGRKACGFVEAPPQPDYDPATQAVRWDQASEAWVVEALPPPPPAPEPVPQSLTKLAFVTLCQKAGGMTPTLYMQARKSPDFEYLWDMLGFAEVVGRDNEFTVMALDALAAGGFMPNGAKAVRDAWPTA